MSKKALSLGVPYVTFTTVTWVLKKVFSSSVNDQIGGLGDTLFLHPTAPYWYLHALFFIFLVTPTFSSVKAAIGLILALVAKVLILTWGQTSIYAISTVLSNEIWFVLGMSICVFNVQLTGKRAPGAIGGLPFMILSVAVSMMGIRNNTVSFAMGLLACVAVILMVAGYEDNFGKCMDFLAEYTVPIFLMHTLFAAQLRSILLKVNVENAAIHVVIGIGISFVGPIIAAWIMKKTKWLEFCLYPNKFVN